MSVERYNLKRIGLATAIPRGRGIWIPGVGISQAYTGGGGEFGAQIIDEDRTFAIIREPIAHRVVFTVAHDIFDNWFELKIIGDEKGEKSKQFDANIQKQLELLKAKRELTLMSVFERTYGWAVLVLGYEDEAKTLRGQLKNASSIQQIKAYGPPQISKVDLEKDRDNPRYGEPIMYHISRLGITAPLQVHYTRVIHFATRRTYYAPYGERKMWQGLSVLDPIWDDLVTLRNIRWGMGQTMYRYGSGFPVLTFEGATKEQLDEWVDTGSFADLSARTFFAGTEKQKVEFAGVAGHQLDPMNYYLPIMENISAGTGVPLAILRGVQAGALTGSEVNQQEYYGLISDEQSAYEPGIRQLIGIIQGFSENQDSKVEYEFNWQGGFELDEEKKARIEQIEAQTLRIQGEWMTRNEIRKKMDPNLDELSDFEGGNEILGRSSMQQFNKGETWHVKPLGDGSSTVTELRKRGRSH